MSGAELHTWDSVFGRFIWSPIYAWIKPEVPEWGGRRLKVSFVGNDGSVRCWKPHAIDEVCFYADEVERFEELTEDGPEPWTP